MSIRLAISMGDFNGIGPEIILKSCSQIIASDATPVVIGHDSIFEFYSKKNDLVMPEYKTITKPSEIEDEILNILNLNVADSVSPQPGAFSEESGRLAMKAVEKGTDWCLQEYTHALVTAPISKEAVNKAGYHIPGHTEFLAERTQAEEFMMILAQDELRVGLVTIHIPVSKIAEQISKKAVKKNIRIMHASLKNDFGIEKPRIAVLGLNPHAGDGGVIGREEIEIITPVISELKEDNTEVCGPFPADGFFGNKKYEEFDGILAMYHDQGLVPFKTLSFGGGVNVTAGLPIVRTSPDHGTAFDIAGKNVANPSSFLKAAKLAVRISENRLKINA